MLAGKATLVTGGSCAPERAPSPPGETRGVSIEGGTLKACGQGDMAHVPAGTPHQMLLKGDNTITCLVMKVQEAV